MPAKTGSAKLAAVIGHPVKHSLSPGMHEFWLREYDINGAYIPLDVAPRALSSTLTFLMNHGFVGANLTIPHKEAGFVFAQSHDELVQKTGAANTLVFKEGCHAFNTDIYGFTQSLLEGGFKAKSSRPAMILGSGGAARGIAVALIEMGIEHLIIANRSIAKAEALIRQLSMQPGLKTTLEYVALEAAEKTCSEAQLLVNTTSLGMNGQPELKFDCAKLPKDAHVSDIVYNPLLTKLLEDAQKQGLSTSDGLAMLIYQGAAAFEKWFGRMPEASPSLRSYLEGLLK